jgi:hypothetical protein
MKKFEIFSKKDENGRRNFKLILCEIFPDSCVDEVNEVGTMFNKNGITWLREYCEKALPSIEGMSLRCEFIDDERTEIFGHGDTGVIDDSPTFENAVVIGTFKRGYIDEIETEKGKILALIGEGEIDAQCYHNFVTKLDEDIANGIYPNGSVEIMRAKGQEGIVYKYGYKENGRIPSEFIFSGYALLGIEPADDSAKLIELNEDKHKEDKTMDKSDIKAIVAEVVAEMNSSKAEKEAMQAECDAKVAEANQAVETITQEKNEIVASSEEIQKALDDLKAEYDELNKKYDALWEEKITLEEALGEAKAKERIGELNEAISIFSDTEKDYAKAEIEAFKENPVESEINSVVSKIYEEIGKNAKTQAEKEIQELNSKKEEIEDIFSEVIDDASADDIEDTNIF